MREMVEAEQLSCLYLVLKERVVDAGYGDEVDWHAELEFESTTEEEFLREAAWVVLTSGFRESIVRDCFGGVSAAFLDWRSASRIAACRDRCEGRALKVFGNTRKIRAIGSIVGQVAEDGYEKVKNGVRRGGVTYLRRFPFIGPVTSYHLAKNIGLEVVKPDRHLVRLAEAMGCGSPGELCSTVAKVVGDSVGVVDLVFWRYATLDRDYRELKVGCWGR